MNAGDEQTLKKLTNELANEFRCWDNLYQHGGSDPFWPDGMNLNLVRNHIIYYKHQMEDLLKEDDDDLSLTLFPLQYPEIYYRETPNAVDPNYMAKANEIRLRAMEQLALYEQNPNFRYILDHHNEVFPKGETKATKAAGLSVGKTAGFHRYRAYVMDDDLVSMRRCFREDYEVKAKRWEIYANELRSFLSGHHSQDNVVEEEDPEEDFGDDELDDLECIPEKECTASIPSLEEQLSVAKAKAQKPQIPAKTDEQLSLF